MSARGVVSPLAWTSEEVALPTVVGALRSLLRATSPADVAAVLIETTRSLGARAEVPSSSGGQLPLDLTLGTSPPLVPAGDPEVLALVREVVPSLVEDARLVLDRLHAAGHLAESATLDPLTGVANRRLAMRVIGRLRRGDAVAVVDLDHFKSVNDTHGHDGGDRVLEAFARTLVDAARAGDHVARFGGEEFVLLLPHTTNEGALALLERARTTWAETRPFVVTFSAGVAEVGAGGGREAIRRADRALYRAKMAGRNRVEEASDG